MSPEHGVRWGSLATTAVLAGVAMLGACIIPDRGIRFESDADNPGAVRIVEAIPLPREFTAACNREREPDRGRCPQVPDTLPQGLIADGPYCLCPGGDLNALPEFSIYAEDPDRVRDGPKDTLYAVALRDLDRNTDEPQTYVAYPEHLTPGGPGEYIADRNTIDPDSRLEPSIGRDDDGLWRFRFGKDGGQGTDLCNDDDGDTLSPGLHNLQIMVTDRPFFRPARLDAEGEPLLDDSGHPLLLRPQFGMPNLAIGATWAVANYVFSCEDPGDDDGCDCAEEAS